jgi:hypothetical protein
MTPKALATAVAFLGIILPGTLTLIFKNGCTQNNTSQPHHSRTNSTGEGTRSGVGTSGNPSTDISTNLLQHAASTQKAKANEIP